MLVPILSPASGVIRSLAPRSGAGTGLGLFLGAVMLGAWFFLHISKGSQKRKSFHGCSWT